MPPAAAWEGSAGRGFASARISFAVFAHGAFPAEMHHAQKLQKIFPVAEGDHSQGPSCSVEREYCPHCFNCPDFLRFHDDKLMFFDYTCSS